MSNRRAQDERIEGTPDGVNAITEIVDVPDAPTIGTATAGLGNVSVAFTPATTGGTATLFTAISSPGSFTGTSATSPITVSGLAVGTSYSFTVRGSNSTGTGPYSSASNSASPLEVPGSYDALADVTVPSGGLASITFAGLPTGYKHIEIKTFAANSASNNQYIKLQFNGDTETNYAEHHLSGNGSTVTAGGNASYNNGGYFWGMGLPGTALSNVFGAGVTTILDYTNTNKYKTIRSLDGFDGNGSGGVEIVSSLWQSTSAITSITLTVNGSNNFAQYSSIALYGVK